VTWAIVAIGLVFLLEGLMWMAAPRNVIEILAEGSDQALRIYGGLVALAGAAILWFMT
jgi:uncharacterized protein YjeT (DUF2065 family)